MSGEIGEVAARAALDQLREVLSSCGQSSFFVERENVSEAARSKAPVVSRRTHAQLAPPALQDAIVAMAVDFVSG